MGAQPAAIELQPPSTEQDFSPRSARERWISTLVGSLAALVVYLALTVPFVQPPWSELDSRLPGDLGDPMLNTYFLAWGAHFFDGGADDFWSANFFWPTERPMLRSDHLLGPAFVHFVLWKVFGAGSISSYNLLFFAAFAVTGWTTCLVLRATGASWLAAFLGGLCFSFGPQRWDQAPHLQVLLAPAVAPALWWFHRFLESGRLRWGALFVVAYGVQMLCGNYLAYFLNLALLALALYHLVRQGRGLLTRRRILSSLALAAICGAIAAPIYGPYILHGATELERMPEEVSILGASVVSFSRANPAVSRYPRFMTRDHRSENALFPGAVALILALPAFVRRIRTLPVRRPAGTGLALVGVGLAMALFGLVIAETYTLGPETLFSKHGWLAGPANDPAFRRPFRVFVAGVLLFLLGSRLATGSVWPFRLRSETPTWLRALMPVALIGLMVSFSVVELSLREVLPGLSGLRAISRALILFYLAFSAFAALGLDDARAWFTRFGRIASWTVAVALVALFALEIRPRLDWPRPLDPADTASMGRFLASRDDVHAIAEFPTGRFPQNQASIMYRSTQHWKPMVNGYSGTIPALTRELLEAGRVPTAATVEKMRKVGVTHILVSEWGRGYSPDAWRRVLARFDEQHRSLGLEHEITLDGMRLYRILPPTPPVPMPARKVVR